MTCFMGIDPDVAATSASRLRSSAALKDLHRFLNKQEMPNIMFTHNIQAGSVDTVEQEGRGAPMFQSKISINTYILY